jgi:hypothetical protein
MSKLSAILEDPSLEEHFIYYVGVRHMHVHWEQFLDPALPFEWDILELFYKEMRQGTFENLKLALRKAHRISSSDPDFKQLLDAAISVIVARHGMEQILATAREFLHLITAEKSEQDPSEVDFSAPVLTCPHCERVTVSLTVEDLPSRILDQGPVQAGDFYGFCIPCGHIFPRHAQTI